MEMIYVTKSLTVLTDDVVENFLCIHSDFLGSKKKCVTMIKSKFHSISINFQSFCDLFLDECNHVAIIRMIMKFNKFCSVANIFYDFYS